MKKRLGVLFISVLIVIIFLVSALPALANPGDELSYDDGAPNASVGGWVASSGGSQQRVTFTPIYVPAKVTTVKIFIMSGSAELIVRIITWCGKTPFC
ncbi:hypothetical protein ACFLV0_06500 [Chloroflexota bacterium]